jgi:hypothetical protein
MRGVAKKNHWNTKTAKSREKHEKGIPRPNHLLTPNHPADIAFAFRIFTGTFAPFRAVRGPNPSILLHHHHLFIR